MAKQLPADPKNKNFLKKQPPQKNVSYEINIYVGKKNGNKSYY